jgi:antirestriction protein ArdC
MNGYDRITERIIELLEQGTVPWHKPWKAKTAWPRNLLTKKPYRGVNVFLLVSMSYESPFWLTFHQAQELGGSIRKGEKACPVVFWKRLEIEDAKTGEAQRIPLLRIYHVFNTAQCEGLKALPAADDLAVSVTKPAEIMAHMPHPPALKHGMSRAYYSPAQDEVGLPHRERFETETGYYATLFHELVHSTGHKSRLHRATLVENTGFGSDPYSREEFIAELGSAFLCGYAEIVDRTIDNSAAYLESWLKQLKNDRTLIVQAAAQAQKAADYITGITPAQQGEVAE